MAFSLLLALASVLVPQSPRNGLLNSSFERELVVGTIGTNPTKKVDGAFWVGGEDRTELNPPGTNRYLCLEANGSEPFESEIAYQRVAAPLGQAESAEISGKIFVKDSNGEGRITFSDPRPYWPMHWVLRGASKVYYHNGDEIRDSGGNVIGLNRWKAWLLDEGVLSELEYQGQILFALPGMPHVGEPNTIDELYVNLQVNNAGYMEVIYHVPANGWVRLINRPYFAAEVQGMPQNPQDFKFSIAHKPVGGSFGVLAEEVVVQNDTNGPMMLVRHHVSVGDEIRFRWQKTLDDELTDNPNLLIGGHPVVLYEGNSYTYRFGPNLPPAPPLGLGEVFEDISVPANQWVNFSTLLAGQDHHAVFCSGFCPADLFPPVDVKLTSISGEVHFDDIDCTIDWDDRSAPGLRADILDEARWFRNVVLGETNPSDPDEDGVLDHDDYGWMRGYKNSFYRSHRLRIDSGPQDLTGTSIALIQRSVEAGVWDLLKAQFDARDYEHFTTMVEERFEPGNKSPVGIGFFKYNVELDVFKTGLSDYGPGIWPFWGPSYFPPIENDSTLSYDDATRWYRRTRDPRQLDRAYEAAQTFVAHGVLLENQQGPPSQGWPDRSGFIAFRAFDVHTGVLQYMNDDEAFEDQFGLGGDDGYKTREHVSATGPLLEIYASARLFNETNPTLNPPRYDTSMNAIVTLLRSSVTAAAGARNPKKNNTTGAWGPASWQRHLGLFNDVWGNQGEDLLRAYLVLKELDAVAPLSGDDQVMFDLIETKWLEEGTAFFYGLWEQSASRNEFIPGDHERGWPMFVEVINNPAIAVNGPATRDDMRQLVHDTALFAMKAQHEGRWAGMGMGRFQLADIASNQTGPPAGFVVTLGHAAEVGPAPDPETPSQAADLRAYLLAYLEATQEHFKSNYGYFDNLELENPSQEETITERTLAAFLAALERLGDEQFTAMVPAPPTLIVPASFEHQDPAQTPVRFQFRLDWGPGHPATPQERLDAFNQRTEIFEWRFANFEWTATKVFPATPSLFTIPKNIGNVTQVRHKMPVPPAQVGEVTKYVLVTFDDL